MSPETRQRLLAFAQQMVDRKVSERTYLGGDRTTITDRLISLQLGQPPPPEEPEDIWIRVWAEFTITQVSDPAAGYPPLYPFPSTTFSSPLFPVFTLRPATSQAAARQAQLDKMEYFLDNALVYSNATTLLYSNNDFDTPKILNLNGESWNQGVYPPYYPTYPGFPKSNFDLLRPYQIGGPSQQFDNSTLVLTINTSATVTLYVRTHVEDTLDTFAFGGNARTVRLTTRHVGYDELLVPGGGVPRQIAALQDATVPPGGSTSFSYSSISSVFTNIEETVGLVGFEFL
jgi:hypothetical protein